MNEWDKSAWGPSASNTQKLPDGPSRWGAPSQPEASSSKANERTKSTWDSGAKPDDNQGGSGAATWGAGSSSDGWGTMAQTWGTATNAAWGSLLGNADESKTDEKQSGGGDAWGTGGTIATLGENTQEASHWGATDNGQKSEGKGKQKEDTKMRHRSLSDAWSAHPPDATLVRPAPTSPNIKPVLPHINPTARAPSQELKSQSPIFRTSPTKPPASLSDLQLGFSLESDLKRETEELFSKRAQGGGKTLPFDSVTGSTPTSSNPTKRYIGPKGRVALFSAIVQYAHILSSNHYHHDFLISILLDICKKWLSVRCYCSAHKEKKIDGNAPKHLTNMNEHLFGHDRC